MLSPIATATSDENELTIYARMTDLEGLKQAQSVEHHEQYELKATKDQSGNSKGKVRIRKTTIGEVVNYSMTTKLNQGSSKIDSNKEYTIPIDVEYFNAFKHLCTNGMNKMRYVFPIDKTVLTGISDGQTDLSFAVKKKQACYEVDVFTDPDGNTYSWVKIDIELDAVMDIVTDRVSDDTKIKIAAKISSLPFAPKEMFIGRSATEEQKKLMDYLYKEVFTVNL